MKLSRTSAGRNCCHSVETQGCSECQAAPGLLAESSVVTAVAVAAWALAEIQDSAVAVRNFPSYPAGWAAKSLVLAQNYSAEQRSSSEQPGSVVFPAASSDLPVQSSEEHCKNLPQLVLSSRKGLLTFPDLEAVAISNKNLLPFLDSEAVECSRKGLCPCLDLEVADFRA